MKKTIITSPDETNNEFVNDRELFDPEKNIPYSKKNLVSDILTNNEITTEQAYNLLKTHNFTDNFIKYIQLMITCPNVVKTSGLVSEQPATHTKSTNKAKHIDNLLRYMFKHKHRAYKLLYTINKTTDIFESLTGTKKIDRKQLFYEFQQLAIEFSPVLHFNQDINLIHSKINPGCSISDAVSQLSLQSELPDKNDKKLFIHQFLSRLPENRDEKVTHEVIMEYLQCMIDDGLLNKMRTTVILQYIKANELETNTLSSNLQSLGLTNGLIDTLQLCKRNQADEQVKNFLIHISNFFSTTFEYNTYKRQKNELICGLELFNPKKNRKYNYWIAIELIAIRVNLPLPVSNDQIQIKFNLSNVDALEPEVAAILYLLCSDDKFLNHPYIICNEWSRKTISLKLISKYKRARISELKKSQISTIMKNTANQLIYELLRVNCYGGNNYTNTIIQHIIKDDASPDTLKNINISPYLITFFMNLKEHGEPPEKTAFARLFNLNLPLDLNNKKILEKYFPYKEPIYKQKIIEFMWTELKALRLRLPSPIPTNPDSWYYKFLDNPRPPPITKNSIQINPLKIDAQYLPSYVYKCKQIASFFSSSLYKKVKLSKLDNEKAEAFGEIYDIRCGLN